MKLTDYDIIGFDLNHTLVQYNLANLVPLQYKELVLYLIEKKGYDGLTTEMNKSDKDFLRRGLIIDINKGNILNISGDGKILQASHGTKKLTKEELITIYGEETKWELTELFLKDKLNYYKHSRNHPYSSDLYIFLDLNEAVTMLVFAKLVDLVDEKSGSKNYKVNFNDVLEGENFILEKSSKFYNTIKNELPKFIYKNVEIAKWFENLAKQCKLILITDSEPVVLEHIAKYILPENWKNLFYTKIYKAKKPNFFYETNKFLDIEGNIIKLKEAKGEYFHGNWQELYDMLAKDFGRSVKCLYMGDNILKDVYAPKSGAFPPMDTISIMEEILADGYLPDGVHPHTDYLRSTFWGKFFKINDKLTILGDTIVNNSKLCISSVNDLVDKPLDYCYKPFWMDNTAL